MENLELSHQSDPPAEDRQGLGLGLGLGEYVTLYNWNGNKGWVVAEIPPLQVGADNRWVTPLGSGVNIY